MRQTTRTLVTLLASIVVAGALGLYAWLGVYRPDEAETKRKDRAERLFAPQKVDERERDGGTVKTEWTKLTVMTEAGVTVLTRAPGQEWRVVSPVKARADKLVVDGLTSQLQLAKFKATLEEAPDDATLAKYGLKPPKFSVEAEAEVGEEEKERRTVRLEGGIENTFDGSVYLRRAGDEAVHTAEGGVRWALAKSTLELRAKDVLAIEQDKARSVALKSKANDWVLEKQADKSWRIVKPISELADAQQITTLFGALKREAAQAFPADTPDARKQLGLEAPLIDLTVTLDDGKTVRLRLGKDASGKISALRTDEEGDTLAEVAATAPSAVDHNVSLFRDKSVLTFKKEAVTRIVLHGEGPEVVLERASVDGGAESWAVSAPQRGPAKVFKITSVLWTLTGLRSTKLEQEKPKAKDLVKYGLDAKAKWVALFGADGKELARLVIGKAVPDNAAMVYARGTRDQVDQLDSSRLGELPFKVEDVLDVPPPPPPRSDGG